MLSCKLGTLAGVEVDIENILFDLTLFPVTNVDVNMESGIGAQKVLDMIKNGPKVGLTRP